MPKLLDFRFAGGDMFLNCDNTELKRSFKIFFSVSERHRWAVVDNGVRVSSGARHKERNLA